LILLFVILAFALRVYQLDAKSIWLDEGTSLNRASGDLAFILSNKVISGGITSTDPHPPLYFLLLHFMIKIAGDSDFSLRFPSVFFGVLIVPLVYFMGKRLYDTQTGLVAAFLTVLSPFYLWYSQEARMYTLLTFLGLLSAHCLLHTSEDRGIVWIIGFALSAIAMTYTSFFGFVFLVFEVILGLGLVWTRRSWRILLTLMLVCLAPLPSALYFINLRSSGVGYGVNDLATILRDVLNSFNFGLSFDPTQLYFLNWVFVIIFFGALFAPTKSFRLPWRRSLFLFAYVLVPSATLYLIIMLRPIYRGSRYLMVITPAYYLGLSAGLMVIKRRMVPIFGLCLAVIIGGMVFSDYNYFFDPSYLKEDYRSVARYIEEHSQSGDVFVGDREDSFAFDHYYSGPLPTVFLPRQGKDIVMDVQETSGQYDRIWLLDDRLFDHDPQGRVRAWLDNRLFKTATLVFPSYGSSPTLLAYLTTSPLLDRLPAVRYPLEASFGGKIALRGYDLPLGVPPAGERLRLTLYLQAEQALEEDYKISVRLVDAEGHLWGQYDNLPLNGAFPTSHWSPETTVREWCDVPIQPGTPPGSYWLELRMYRPGTAEDLEVFVGGEPQGQVITLGQVEVSEPTSAASLAEMPIQHRMEADWHGGLKLLGYDFAAQVYQAGDGLALSLYYQAVSPPKKDYLLRLQLVDRTGTILTESLSSLGGETYPTSRWGEEVMIKSQHGLAIPPDTPGGRLKLRASLVDPEGEPLLVRCHPWTFWARNHLNLTAVRVSERERSYQLPPIEHAMRADLGDQVEFHGYILESVQVEPGGLIRLTLYWRARQRMTVNYTVFTHLLGEDGGIWGQRDNIPVEGTYPTTGWVDGEVITDEYEIAIKPEAPSGDYQIEVGMYDAATGQRLPVFDEGGTRLPGDRILLDQVITVW
jgi:hypothetical protein